MIKRVDQLSRDLDLKPLDIYRTYFAFVGDENKLRTIGGVSRETGLERSVIDKVLINNQDFFASPIRPSGITLYGLIM